MTVHFKNARKKWCYDFSIQGRRFSGYCDDPVTGIPAKTKTEAKAIEMRIRSRFYAGQSLRRANPRTYSVAEAFAAFMAQYVPSKHTHNLHNYVRELITYFGATTPLIEITHQRVLEYVAWSRRQKIRR